VQITRISVGVIRRRGADVTAPALASFGDAEAEFLARHVARVRADGLGGRSLFVNGAHIPSVLAGMLAATDDDFVAASGTLLDNLARAMGQVARPSDCVFAVVQAQQPGAVPQHVTVLKLDAVVEAARWRVQAGRVNLQVLRELLPEPGELRKALSWPDSRPNSDALMIDTNASNAQYFEDAYQLRVSPKSSQAEAGLAATIAEQVAPADLPTVLADAARLEGPADEILASLAQTHPALQDAADAAAADPRPAGLVRTNKVAARPVVWKADGVELRVPADRAGDVQIIEEGDGWRLSVRLNSRPRPTA
jgi:hypothetical protein